MADHGPRRRRLIAPRLRSKVAIPPRSSHGPIAGGAGGAVGGPVLASAMRRLGEALGASASSDVGAGVAVAAGGAVGLGVGVARTADGAMVVGRAVAAVAAGAAQTWAKRVDGGGAPKAEL